MAVSKLLVTLFTCLYTPRARGDLRVPSAPTDALLEVVSGDSLSMTWASPMTDGGAAVQSSAAGVVSRWGSPPMARPVVLLRYQIEWDTNPGTAEVQTVTTSTYTGANELQTITTTAADVDEIQNARRPAFFFFTSENGPRARARARR